MEGENFRSSQLPDPWLSEILGLERTSDFLLAYDTAQKALVEHPGESRLSSANERPAPSLSGLPYVWRVLSLSALPWSSGMSSNDA